MSDYLNIVLQCITSFFSWFSQLDAHFQFGSAIISLFVFGLVYRFLLKPLFGGSAGSSDQVKKRGVKK